MYIQTAPSQLQAGTYNMQCVFYRPRARKIQIRPSSYNRRGPFSVNRRDSLIVSVYLYIYILYYLIWSHGGDDYMGTHAKAAATYTRPVQSFLPENHVVTLLSRLQNGRRTRRIIQCIDGDWYLPTTTDMVIESSCCCRRRSGQAQTNNIYWWHEFGANIMHRSVLRLRLLRYDYFKPIKVQYRYGSR